jgi:hypothetical protein
LRPQIVSALKQAERFSDEPLVAHIRVISEIGPRCVSVRPAAVELSRLSRADPPGHAIRKSKVAPGQYITPMVSQPRLDPAASPRLHDYQRVAHTPGPLLAACLLVVIVALVLARGRGRLLSRRGGRAGRRASSARRHRARARPGRGQLVSCLVI